MPIGPRRLSYRVLLRLDPQIRCGGARGAERTTVLGDIALEVLDFAAPVGCGSRSAVAMIASSTVLTGSLSETNDTMPASQASASVWGSLRVMSTTRSGFARGRGSRSNDASSR